MCIIFSTAQMRWCIQSLGHPDYRVFEMCTILIWKFNSQDIFINEWVWVCIYYLVNQGLNKMREECWWFYCRQYCSVVGILFETNWVPFGYILRYEVWSANPDNLKGLRNTRVWGHHPYWGSKGYCP